MTIPANRHNYVVIVLESPFVASSELHIQGSSEHSLLLTDYRIVF
jgi:hypothetical protein